MEHLIDIEFGGTDYTHRLFTCTHSADQIQRLAMGVWNEAGGRYYLPSLYENEGKPIREKEIAVLRKLFLSEVEEEYGKYREPEESKEYDDRTFLELAEIGTRWESNMTISLLFRLAKLADASIQYTEVQNKGTITL